MQEILNRLIDNSQNEIKSADFMIGFYNWQADNEMDKEKSATLRVKADQIVKIKENNQKTIEQLTEYGKTL